MEFWELVAREHIRDTLARYNWSGDALRLDELAHLDHYGRYRAVFVPVDGTWLIRHRFVSTDWSAPDSTMARR